MKTFRVRGEEGESEVRIRMLCRRTWPVKLYLASALSTTTLTPGPIKRRILRNYHEQLLICRALQLGFGVHPLSPCLLAYCAAAVRVFLVQRMQFAEVDLFVEDVLQCGCDVIAVVMYVVMRLGVLFIVAVAVVMVVGHCCGDVGGVGGVVSASDELQVP